MNEIPQHEELSGDLKTIVTLMKLSFLHSQGSPWTQKWIIDWLYMNCYLPDIEISSGDLIAVFSRSIKVPVKHSTDYDQKTVEDNFGFIAKYYLDAKNAEKRWSTVEQLEERLLIDFCNRDSKYQESARPARESKAIRDLNFKETVKLFFSGKGIRRKTIDIYDEKYTPHTDQHLSYLRMYGLQRHPTGSVGYNHLYARLTELFNKSKQTNRYARDMVKSWEANHYGAKFDE